MKDNFTLSEKLDMHLKALGEEFLDSAELESRIIAMANSQEQLSAAKPAPESWIEQFWRHVSSPSAGTPKYAAVGFSLMLVLSVVGFKVWSGSSSIQDTSNLIGGYEAVDLEWDELWLLEDELVFAQLDSTQNL